MRRIIWTGLKRALSFRRNKRTNDLLEKSVKDVRSYGLNISEFAVLELLYNKGPQPINNTRTYTHANSSTTYI